MTAAKPSKRHYRALTKFCNCVHRPQLPCSSIARHVLIAVSALRELLPRGMRRLRTFVLSWQSLSHILSVTNEKIIHAEPSPYCVSLMHPVGISLELVTRTVNERHQGLASDGLNRILAVHWLNSDSAIFVDSLVSKHEDDLEQNISLGLSRIWPLPCERRCRFNRR